MGKSNLGSGTIQPVQKFGGGGITDPEANKKTAAGTGTLFDVPKDVIWGWNWKESMPNAVISQLTTFLCLWAIEQDYTGTSDFKNPRVEHWKDLLSSGYELSSQESSLVDFGDGKKEVPRIRPINRDYQCLIDKTPVKYIPALPNISQVLTKDAKGGVGIDRISINAAYSDKMYIDMTITISNALELMEQNSFWRFFTVGQHFMLTVGWQDDGLGYYRPDQHEESGALMQKFKDFPTRTMIPPIIDPHTNKLNEFFFDIDTTSPKYLYPAFGFWQSFVMVLQVPSFTMDGSKLSGSLRFITPGQFMSKMILTGQISAGATDFINKKAEDAVSMSSKMNSDIGFKTGEYNADKLVQYQMMYIKLGYALESLFASYNSYIYKSKLPDMTYQQTMIFYSKDGDKKIGDVMNAPILEGVGPEGKCNFWTGVEDGGGGTPLSFTHANKIIDHLLLEPAYKEKSVYWHEGDQQNQQQAIKKDLKTIISDIKSISDIPIHLMSFRRFVDDNKGMIFTDMIQKFCDQFLLQQTGFAFHLVSGQNQNNYNLVLADQFYKSTIQQARNKVAQAAGLPALAFRQYLLDTFRWKHLTLRYGDYQSLVSNATMMQQLDVQRSIMEFMSVELTAKTLGNATAAMRSGGDIINAFLNSKTLNQQITPDFKQSRVAAQADGNKEHQRDGHANITPSGNPAGSGDANLSNKGYYGRNEMLKALIAMGMEPESNGTVWSTVGSYIKGFLDKIDITIHGTFGIYEAALVYFVGTFEFLRGFYNVISVNHEIARGDFVTRFEMRYMGRDAVGDAPSFSFFDPIEGKLVTGEGMSTDDVLGQLKKGRSEEKAPEANASPIVPTPAPTPPAPASKPASTPPVPGQLNLPTVP